MTDTDRRLVGLGLVTAAAGLVVGEVTGVGRAVLPRTVSPLLLLGAAALALAVAVTRLRDTTDTGLELPTPERRPDYRIPGTELAELLDGVSPVGRRRGGPDPNPDAAPDPADETTADTAPAAGGDGELFPRDRLHARLHDLAVGVLVRLDGVDEPTAARQLSSGDWPASGPAKEFFAGSRRPSVSWRDSLPWRATLPFARRGRHAVAALVEQVYDDGPDPDARLRRRSTGVDGSYWPTERLPHRRSTGRAERLVVAVLVTSAVGVVLSVPGALLAGTLALAVVGAARARPFSAELELSRSVDTQTPAPGESVVVDVTVRNVGQRTCTDIRIIDGVPPGLAVTGGSPRFATALRPGHAATFSYTLTAVAGVHRFEPAVVTLGDICGTREHCKTVAATSESLELDCGFDARTEAAPGHWDPRSLLSGQHAAAATGDGLEFESLREYTVGDPPGRIDWNHRARTGDLATVEYRDRRTPTVIVMIDTRPATYVAGPDGVPAPRRGAVAGFALVTALLDDGVPVGAVATHAASDWLAPTTGARQRAALREFCAEPDAVPWQPPADEPVADLADQLAGRLPTDGRVVFVSPLSDDGAVDLAHRLHERGPAVTVLALDLADRDTVEGGYARLQRWRRISTLRAHGLTVMELPGPVDPNPGSLESPTEEVTADGGRH